MTPLQHIYIGLPTASGEEPTVFASEHYAQRYVGQHGGDPDMDVLDAVVIDDEFAEQFLIEDADEERQRIWRIPDSHEFEVVDIGDENHEPSTLMIGTRSACRREYPDAIDESQVRS